MRSVSSFDFVLTGKRGGVRCPHGKLGVQPVRSVGARTAEARSSVWHLGASDCNEHHADLHEMEIAIRGVNTDPRSLQPLSGAAKSTSNELLTSNERQWHLHLSNTATKGL